MRLRPREWASFRLVSAVLLSAALATGCGLTADRDWYYHWSCNGDSECLSLNPTGASSGTSNEGPEQVNCTQLMEFSRRFWNMPPATDSCDQSSATPPAPPSPLTSITVTPANYHLAIGQTQQFTATGRHLDGTTQDLTAQVTWSASCGITLCSPGPAASIGAAGLAAGVAIGSITIKATLGSIAGSTTLTVSAAPVVLSSITVTPPNPTIHQYADQQFTATGNYSDGSSQVLSSASWTSGAPATATTSPTGLVTALLAGTSTITATVGLISGSTLLTVTPVTLQSIAVTPTDPRLPQSMTLQLTALGTYSDATVRDITAQATWASADPAAAPISGGGLVTGATLGPSLVSASLAGRTGSTTVTVTAAALQSIVVTPVNPEVVIGLSAQLTATGTFSDASTLDVTALATWTSGSPANATVVAGGAVTGVAVGTSVIEATLGGISGSTGLVVHAPGSAWAPVTSGPGGGSGATSTLMGITYAGSQFVAVGAGGTILTSPDGIAWTDRVSGVSDTLNAIVWTGTKLVAVGNLGTLLSSTDGITWADHSVGGSVAGGHFAAVTWTGVLFVAVGNGTSVFSSPDGDAWTLTNPSGGTGTGNTSIAWDGAHYVMGTGFWGGQYFMSSTDLATWNMETMLGTPSVVYGLLWNGTQLVAVQGGGAIRTSTDFTAFNNWVLRATGTSAALSAVAWSGSQYVVVGDAGTVLTSPDSVTWSLGATLTSRNLRGVAWSGSRFVAVGDLGEILVSAR